MLDYENLPHPHDDLDDGYRDIDEINALRESGDPMDISPQFLSENLTALMEEINQGEAAEADEFGGGTSVLDGPGEEDFGEEAEESEGYAEPEDLIDLSQFEEDEDGGCGDDCGCNPED